MWFSFYIKGRINIYMKRKNLWLNGKKEKKHVNKFDKLKEFDK
jgi:hypothetical protein